MRLEYRAGDKLQNEIANLTNSIFLVFILLASICCLARRFHRTGTIDSSTLGLINVMVQARGTASHFQDVAWRRVRRANIAVGHTIPKKQRGCSKGCWCPVEGVHTHDETSAG